jgi:S1-C subfamily serine protease
VGRPSTPGWCSATCLLALDGRPTPDVDDVLAALGPDTPGTVLRARLLRAGELRTLPVTVGEPPAADRAAQG